MDEKLESEIVPRIKERGFIDKQDFLYICRWKTPRTQKRCYNNSEEYIREIARIALSTENTQLQIEILTLLEGVGWPTASTILHFTHKEDYPILDFRTLWSLNCDVPNRYTNKFWEDYTFFCRGLSKENGVSIRVLDKALWQYSKENEKKS